MRFPNCLSQKNKKVYPETKISLKNRMYARHKPSVDWKDGEEYPDFSKIRTDQSFNWSAFSIPSWAKFNDNKVYYSDYGVAGYSVDTIRNVHKYSSEFEPNSYGVEHKPLTYNYSHCEIYPNNLTKKEKRAYRMLLKHNCIRPIYPRQENSKLKILYDYIIMFIHRMFVVFNKAQGTTIYKANAAN
ncbi:MAG: hypothetical protein PF517_13055 [Salinivirgaceae bacterium]|jgi:hypothetical protein|nr:hypothetical protein [Salinivirgaceae bacterium]